MGVSTLYVNNPGLQKLRFFTVHADNLYLYIYRVLKHFVTEPKMLYDLKTANERTASSQGTNERPSCVSCTHVYPVLKGVSPMATLSWLLLDDLIQYRVPGLELRPGEKRHSSTTSAPSTTSFTLSSSALWLTQPGTEYKI